MASKDFKLEEQCSRDWQRFSGSSVSRNACSTNFERAVVCKWHRSCYATACWTSLPFSFQNISRKSFFENFRSFYFGLNLFERQAESLTSLPDTLYCCGSITGLDFPGNGFNIWHLTQVLQWRKLTIGSRTRVENLWQVGQMWPALTFSMASIQIFVAHASAQHCFSTKLW